jgi:peptidoglycan/xylan/chitin deacetylase (PgdA/CDA1 family)
MSWVRSRTFSMGKSINPKSMQNFGVPKIGITFDDAFENLLENVLPVLEEYQISAIVFAVPGNLGRKPEWAIASDHPEANEKVMTAEQLIVLSKNPLIRIGSHTLTHPDLTKLTSKKIRQELSESKQRLESLLDNQVEDLALPHGALNDTVSQIAREVGYKRIYTLEPQVISEENLHEGLIGRFSMSPDVWPIEFILTGAGAYAWLSTWRRVIRQLKCLIHRT